MNMSQIIDTATVQLTSFGLKVAGAIAVWIVGRYLIGLAVRLVSAALTRQQVDPTILRYLGNIITVTLNIILVIAILGYFGVETTSFAALIAAAGIAIGAAWAGLLGNVKTGSSYADPNSGAVISTGDAATLATSQRCGRADRRASRRHHTATRIAVAPSSSMRW
jgi:hypothetical protein